VPFGTFETHLVSDPLTLEIGETNETAVVAGFARGGFGGAVYVFNGDSDGIHDAIGGPVSDFVAGYTLDALFSSGPFTVIAEYTTAADSFTATELPFECAINED
jgi:hypothetical protein